MKLKDCIFHDKKRLAGLLFFVLIFGLTVYYIVGQIKPHDIARAYLEAYKPFLFLSISMVFVFLFMQGLCYKVCFSAMGIKTTLTANFRYSCADFFGAAITPSATGGQPLCAYFMAKDGIPVYKSGPILLLQTIVFKIILIVLSVAALFIRPDFAMKSGALGKWLFILGVVINIVVVAVCFMAMFSTSALFSLGSGIISLLERLHISRRADELREKYRHWLEEYARSSNFISKNVKAVLFTVFFTVIQRLALFAIPYFIYRSMGVSIEAKAVDFFALQIILSMSVDSMPSPGAMGISEMLFRRFFNHIYSAEVISSAMVLTRGISHYFCMAFAAVVSLIGYIAIHKQKKKEI